MASTQPGLGWASTAVDPVVARSRRTRLDRVRVRAERRTRVLALAALVVVSVADVVVALVLG